MIEPELINYRNYYDNGNLRTEWWETHDGISHNPNVPAWISYYPSGAVCMKSIVINGKHHNLTGPAIIRYYENGNIYCEVYKINERVYRSNGPARIFYDEHGKIVQEEWYDEDGKCCNLIKYD